MFARSILRKYTIFVMRTGQTRTTPLKQMSGNAYKTSDIMKINLQPKQLKSPFSYG